MANILLRSPQYITATYSGMLSATLELTIDSVLVYTITKNATSNRAVFEYSELSRDYIEHSITQTNPSATIDIDITVKKYSGLNGTGTLLDTDTYAHTGYDGYGYFEEGINPDVPVSSSLQTNLDIYLPENTQGYVPVNFNYFGNFFYQITASFKGSFTTGGQTFTVHRICDPKYTPLKITFVNKFGALQEMWFFHKSVEAINTSSETYKSNVVDFSTTTYSTTRHQYTTYNVTGKETIQLNTPFVAEQFNDAMKELMMSEFVWLTKDSTDYPVRPKTSSLQYKTSVNDKLVQYTIDFDYAFDKINNIR